MTLNIPRANTSRGRIKLSCRWCSRCCFLSLYAAFTWSWKDALFQLRFPKFTSYAIKIGAENRPCISPCKRSLSLNLLIKKLQLEEYPSSPSCRDSLSFFIHSLDRHMFEDPCAVSQSSRYKWLGVTRLDWKLGSRGVTANLASPQRQLQQQQHKQPGHS